MHPILTRRFEWKRDFSRVVLSTSVDDYFFLINHQWKCFPLIGRLGDTDVNKSLCPMKIGSWSCFSFDGLWRRQWKTKTQWMSISIECPERTNDRRHKEKRPSSLDRRFVFLSKVDWKHLAEEEKSNIRSNEKNSSSIGLETTLTFCCRCREERSGFDVELGSVRRSSKFRSDCWSNCSKSDLCSTRTKLVWLWSFRCCQNILAEPSIEELRWANKRWPTKSTTISSSRGKACQSLRWEQSIGAEKSSWPSNCIEMERRSINCGELEEKRVERRQENVSLIFLT